MNDKSCHPHDWVLSSGTADLKRDCPGKPNLIMWALKSRELSLAENFLTVIRWTLKSRELSLAGSKRRKQKRKLKRSSSKRKEIKFKNNSKHITALKMAKKWGTESYDVITSMNSGLFPSERRGKSSISQYLDFSLGRL